MGKNKAFIILILLMCVVSLSSCAQNEGVGLQYEDADKYNVDIREYVLEITELEVYWLAGNVKITTGDVENVLISETTSREKYPKSCMTRSYWDNGKLSIAFGREGELNLTNLRKDLTVTFPKNMQLKKVTVRSTSADVELENTLTVESFSAVTKSGKIKAELSALSPVVFSARTKSGNVVATFTRTTSPTIEIETASGRAMIVAMDVKELTFKSSSGDLFLTIPEEVGYNATMESKFGKITSEYGEITHGKGDVSIHAETFTGDVNIKKA